MNKFIAIVFIFLVTPVLADGMMMGGGGHKTGSNDSMMGMQQSSTPSQKFCHVFWQTNFQIYALY